MPFRLRLTLALLSAAVFPLAGFGVVLLTRFSGGGEDPTLTGALVFAIAAAAILGVLLALILAADLTSPLRAIAAAVATLRGIGDTDFDRSGTVLAGMPPVSAGQLAAGLLCTHIDEHLGSIKATVGA